jgi:pimeloyl-ACP methyl ester carboxylesterase
MVLSLSDIDRWDPRTVTAVFDAAISRADGTATASSDIRNTVAFLDWDGDVATAARESTYRTMLDLNTHAEACAAVASAAETAAAEITAIKNKLQTIRDTAEDFYITIVDETGTVLLPSNLSSFSSGDQQLIIDKAADLRSDIATLLARAENADNDLAAAIRGASGDLSPEGVNAEVSQGPVAMPMLPPAGTDPTDVTQWWDSLTPTQQDMLESLNPNSIRNLDGIPSAVRDTLNRDFLTHELDRLRHGWLDENGWHTDPAKLADLESLARAVQGDDTMLLLLDSTSNPFNVLAAVAVGDVDHAERVGVTVGGLNTRVSSSVEGMVGEARTQQQKAAELRSIAGLANPNAVASIAWLGYQAPSGLAAVGQDGLARIGAKDLNSFYRGLGATTTVANQDITAFGHSYGSLTTSLALQQGGAPVDNVVLYGSPGGEITDASQLNVKPGHAYFMIGVNDGVSEIVPGFGAFGPGLDAVPGMTELGVNTTTAPGPGTHLGDGQLHERAYGHSEYARMDNDPIDSPERQLRASGYNMAVILAGMPNPEQSILWPRELPPAVITPGGIGLPIPNPDYHP